MSIPGAANPLLLATAAAGGYTISRSLRFSSIDSAFLSRTPASAGNRKTWTWAGWVKRSASTYSGVFSVNGSDDATLFEARFENDTFRVAASSLQWRATTQVFRDPSSWGHLVIAVDTTQATANSRIRLYWNGDEITTFTTINNPAQNADLGVNRTGAHYIGAGWTSGNPFSGYLADIHFIDGQALDPTSFTEVSATTGQLIPKAYSGSFGTNGFWLKFSDNSAATATTLGKDYSGNSNNWTPNNLSVTAGAGNDSLVDTPSSAGTDTGVGGVVTGNYCAWNPLDAHSSLTITNGNLDLSNTAGTTRNVRGTIGFPSSGKWYYEVTPGGSVQGAIGIGSSAVPFNAQNAASSVTYFEDGSKGVDASRTAYGSSYASGDVIGIAFNADTNQVTFYKNGVSQGALNTTAGVQYFPFIVTFNATYSANFGQRTFAYPVSGFKCLCDTSLPSPVVAKSASAFDVKLYTGNGSTQTISGLGFSPDLVWIKMRSKAYWHELVDTVRGANKSLFSNATDAEATINTVTAFNSDGFSVGTNGGANGGTNEAAGSYVAWAFDAGSSTVSNTQGSITSQVRANASAGFSIVTWTAPVSGSGWTVGHGLGASPFLMIDKCRSNTGVWTVYHQTQGATKALYLNTTDAVQTSSIYWNDTAPSSTVFTCGTAGWYGPGFTHVTYCFAPVAGHSSAFTYTGNGSNSGPFVYLGFRPRFFFVKRTDSTGDWWMYDAARNPYNVTNYALRANSSAAEVSDVGLDMLSNGFRYVNDIGAPNISGASYVGFAWAENPFQYARAR